MTTGSAELDPRREFDVIVTNFSKIDCMLPNSIPVECVKQDSSAVTTSSRETGKKYARTLHIPTSVAEAASYASSSTISRDNGAPDSVTAPARQDHTD